MKRFMLIAIAAALTGCSTYSPDAGHEVVLIEKPYFFGHGASIRILSRLGVPIRHGLPRAKTSICSRKNMRWNPRTR
jgi:hypothetical protein